MFEKLIKRRYYAQKHIDAPLLAERTQYVQSWIDKGHARSTVTSVAQYLLRIIEFIPLPADHVITLKEVELAANKWASYKSKHPQKRASFSTNAKERFMWFAIDWLKKMNRLEPLPENISPLLNRIFERSAALKRHTSAPLLNERLKYLQYWANNGSTFGNLRRIAQYLLAAMDYLHFYELRTVSMNEIEAAANIWAKRKNVQNRKGNYPKFARARFIADISRWFKLLGCLEPSIKIIPFETYLNQYIAYMRTEQGLSENTIRSRNYILQDFLINLYKKINTFIDIDPLYIDNALAEKYSLCGYSRRSVQAYASVIRGFLKYAGGKNWCSKNLWETIKAPRVYKHESLPYSPDWADVKKILADTKTDHLTDIRNYAILMLLAVYGMRCSEVTHLRLEDIDWQNELLHLNRAKGSKPQVFPLSKTVGNAILKYLQQVRANNSNLREVFICMRAPYRRFDKRCYLSNS